MFSERDAGLSEKIGYSLLEPWREPVYCDIVFVIYQLS